MSKRKTHEEFVKELSIKFPEIIVLDKYTNAQEKILFKCNKCLHEFSTKPNTILNSKYGCPKCSVKEVHKKQKEKGYKNMLEAIKGKYELLSNYIDAHTYVTCKCLKCNHIWNITPANLNFGYGCPKCRYINNANKSRTPIQEVIKQAKEIHGNKYDYSKVEYKNIKDKVLIGCPIHGFFKLRLLDHILNKCGCPKCNQSHGERLVSQILDKLNITYQSLYKIISDNKFRLTNKAFIDFYIKLNNLEYFIEYNGELHYIAKEHFGGELKLKLLLNRDLELRNYCKLNNIKLLEIPYYIKDKEVENLIMNFLNE